MSDPRIFISYSHQEKTLVRQLYKRLKIDGFNPWIDEEELIPGAVWEDEIKRALSESHIVLICLTRSSVDKAGYLHKEIRIALEQAMLMSEGTVYIIPVRFDTCALPHGLDKLQWVDLPEGYPKLLAALRFRLKELGRARDEYETLNEELFAGYSPSRINRRELIELEIGDDVKALELDREPASPEEPESSEQSATNEAMLGLLWHNVLKADEVKKKRSRRKILKYIEDGGSLHRINTLKRPPMTERETEEIRAHFPFISPSQPITNFIWLLNQERAARKDQPASRDWLVNGRPWLSFLNAATSPKDQRMTKDWEEIQTPRGRRPKGLRLIIPVRILWLLILSFSAFLVFYEIRSRLADSEWQTLPTLFGYFLIWLSVGFACSLIWPIWRRVAMKRGWIKDMGMVPRIFHLLFNGMMRNQWWRWLVFIPRALVLTLPLGFLISLAHYVVHPNIRDHAHPVQNAFFSSNGEQVFSSDGKIGITRSAATGQKDRVLFDMMDVNNFLIKGTTSDWERMLIDNLMFHKERGFDYTIDGRALTFFSESDLLLVYRQDQAKFVVLGKANEVLTSFPPSTSSFMEHTLNANFSQNGRYLGVSYRVEGSSGTWLEIWDYYNLIPLDSINLQRLKSFRVTNDGAVFFIHGNTLSCWNKGTLKDLLQFDHDIRKFALSSNGQHASVGILSADNKVYRIFWFDLTSPDKDNFINMPHRWASSGLALSPTGNRLLIGGWGEYRLQMIDTQTSKVIWRGKLPYHHGIFFLAEGGFQWRIFLWWMALLGLMIFLPTLSWCDADRRLARQNIYRPFPELDGVQQWLPMR